MNQKNEGSRKRILIVDGYNVINVRKPVRESLILEDARRLLTERLHDYASWTGQQVILVYDAWLSNRKQRTSEKRGLLTVVFTTKGETADQYIERLCDSFEEDIALRRVEVRVATGDLLEQTVVFGRGAIRLSARELINEMDMAQEKLGGHVQTQTHARRGFPVEDRLSPETREKLERMRRGE